MEALKKANWIYRKGAEFRAEVNRLGYSEGYAMLAETLERNDGYEPVEWMRLDRFLTSVKGVGKQRLKKIRAQAGVQRALAWEAHRQGNGRGLLQVRDLTYQERHDLAAVLRSWCPAPEEKIEEREAVAA